MLASDRARGYAVGTSYYGPGITSVAAPVRESSGEVVAAINAVDLRSAVKPEFANKRLIGAVCEAANTISEMLGAAVRHGRARTVA